MTVIVGCVDMDGSVVMGGDAAATSDAGNAFEVRQSKVFVNGEFVFGVAGQARWAQILINAKLPPMPDGTGDVIDRYMAVDFARVVRARARAAGFMQSDHGQDYVDSVALIAVRGRLFCLQGNFDYLEAQNDYMACGIGTSYALGAMHALSPCHHGSDFTASDRIMRAMEAAEKHCWAVRGPFTIVTLKPYEPKPKRHREHHRRPASSQGRR
jgi:ATP-dependent protease HslVU (ClpYQ) peptidase subunit